MYRIKLKKKAMKMDKFSEIIEEENEMKALSIYVAHMDRQYYFGQLVKVVNGKEEGLGSFCNSRYA